MNFQKKMQKVLFFHDFFAVITVGDQQRQFQKAPKMPEICCYHEKRQNPLLSDLSDKRILK